MEEEEGKDRSSAALCTEDAELEERDQTAFKLNSGTSFSAGRCCKGGEGEGGGERWTSVNQWGFLGMNINAYVDMPAYSFSGKDPSSENGYSNHFACL